LVFKVPWGECRERPYVVGNVYGSPSGRCSLRPPGSALNSALRASNYGSPSGRRRWNSLRELDTFSRPVISMRGLVRLRLTRPRIEIGIDPIRSYLFY